MVNLYGLYAGRHHWYSMVALVSGASESVYRGGCYPYVPWHISLYRNDFGGKISQLGYSEPLMITLLTNFLTASSIVGALSIGLSIPGLWLYRKRPRV